MTSVSGCHGNGVPVGRRARDATLVLKWKYLHWDNRALCGAAGLHSDHGFDFLTIQKEKHLKDPCVDVSGSTIPLYHCHGKSPSSVWYILRARQREAVLVLRDASLTFVITLSPFSSTEPP